MKTTDVQQQQERAEFIEYLFEQDGRNNPEHHYHGLYSGLYQMWINKQIKLGMEAWRASDEKASVRPIHDRTVLRFD